MFVRASQKRLQARLASRLMTYSRRNFIKTGAYALTLTGSMQTLLGAGRTAHARPRPRPFRGYGELVADPRGILDLPKGFSYKILSPEGEAITSEIKVPANHDGMAAFRAGAHASWLVRNHEIAPDDVEDGVAPIAPVPGATYDAEGTGGTTTLLVSRERRVLQLRFGLEDGRARTLEEVGKEFNVTRERIRQIEAKALRKLRHPSRSKQLKSFIDS